MLILSNNARTQGNTFFIYNFPSCGTKPPTSSKKKGPSKYFDAHSVHRVNKKRLRRLLQQGETVSGFCLFSCSSLKTSCVITHKCLPIIVVFVRCLLEDRVSQDGAQIRKYTSQVGSTYA